MPAKATTRSALVETINDPTVPPRARRNAAEELIRSFRLVVKSLDDLLGLFPRPIPPDTFNACADAWADVQATRKGTD